MNIAFNPVLQTDDNAHSLRAAMRQCASAVSVITAGAGEERSGLTATSFASLSIEPPTLIVCVNRSVSA